jgi:hypothetical protein
MFGSASEVAGRSSSSILCGQPENIAARGCSGSAWPRLFREISTIEILAVAPRCFCPGLARAAGKPHLRRRKSGRHRGLSMTAGVGPAGIAAACLAPQRASE